MPTALNSALPLLPSLSIDPNTSCQVYTQAHPPFHPPCHTPIIHRTYLPLTSGRPPVHCVHSQTSQLTQTHLAKFTSKPIHRPTRLATLPSATVHILHPQSVALHCEPHPCPIQTTEPSILPLPTCPPPIATIKACMYAYGVRLRAPWHCSCPCQHADGQRHEARWCCRTAQGIGKRWSIGVAGQHKALASDGALIGD